MRRTLASWAILLGVVAFACLPLAALAQRRGGVPFGLNWNRGRTVATGPLLSMALTGNCEGTTPAGLTFTRTSTATCAKADGSLATVAAGQPRLEAQGLLVEGAATNLVLRSAELNDAAWAAFGSAVVTADSTAAPDGLLVAERVDFADTTTASSFTGVQQSLTGASAIHSLSCYAKAVSGTPTLHPYIKGTAQVSTPCPLTSTAWTRCTTTMTVAGVPTFAAIGVDTRAGQTGQPPFSAYVWGCQLETGPVATSYIPTAGTQVTRAADNASAPNPLSGQSPAAWCYGARLNPYVGGAWGGSQRTLLRTGPGTTNYSTLFVSGGGSAAHFVQDAATFKQRFISAGAVGPHTLKGCGNSAGDVALTLDGVDVVGTVNGAGTGVVSSFGATLYLGAADGAATNPLNGHVSQLCVSGPAGGCP